ncbi:hypothetical protein [Streptomyces sp. NPDC020298]|uniref:hypothetical protein n=1 Tax=unclassified Streptomyces TaxID=2593676 RepID=UPI0034034C7F
MTTGIDCLHLVDNAHSNHLGQKINYAALAGPPAHAVDLSQPPARQLPGDSRD